jgi:hypothetical protein
VSCRTKTEPNTSNAVGWPGRRWYRKNHREQLARAARYRQAKEQNDPTFRVFRSLQTNFRARLKNLGVSDPPNLETMLGCKWAFFTEHISGQFTAGIKWDTYGKDGWVFHHLRNVNSFDFKRRKSDVLLVHAWFNLRPMNDIENGIRHDRIFDDDLDQLERNIAKAHETGLVGRLPRQRATRVWHFEQWLKLRNQPF